MKFTSDVKKKRIVQTSELIKALLRNFIYRFICRLNDSKNEIIVSSRNKFKG